MKVDERCTETFELREGHILRCSKKATHRDKHLSLDDGWVAWTDQGKERVLRERAEKNLQK